jgi:uncharacterized repeat protein (TIGR01451 family)
VSKQDIFASWIGRAIARLREPVSVRARAVALPQPADPPAPRRRRIIPALHQALLLAGLLLQVVNHSASAATCGAATSGGTAPADWATYCWLDFSSYNDTLARSAGGQAFTFTLPDGSTLGFVATVTSTAATGLKPVAAPSWTGAAVGNTAFLGIPGKPVLYTTTGPSTVTVTFSNIVLTPPPGVTGGATYSFVAADGESTNQNESLAWTTNGTNWVVLDQVPPITGNLYPTITNTGTTFTETGVAGTVGGYIVGSLNATQVTTVLVAGGLQGSMFAVRNSIISLNKTLVGGRVNAADQFTYSISATSSGTVLGSTSSSGSGSGPFGATSSFLTTPQSLTVSEVMAPGSVSTLAAYSPSLTCTNAASGSSTPLPTNDATSSYVFASIAFGDSISCMFTNTRKPAVLSVTKSAPSPALKVGVNSTYTLTVTNSGGAAATTAEVEDQLPASLTFISATGTNWTCGNASSLITCNFAGGTIAVAGTSTIAVTVSAPVAAGGTSVTNYASIDPTGGTGPPAPGAGCAPAGSCTSAGPSTVIYVNAVPQSGAATAGTGSTPIANVAAGGTVNGTAATLGSGGNATVAQSGTWPAGLTLNTTTGAITTTASLPPGSYSVVYQLCDKSSPPNCATATDAVTVSASIVPATATGTAVAGTPSTPIANVAAGGTVNGAAATLGGSGNATVAQSGTWPAGLTLNTTSGAITTTASLPPGSYSVVYQLCDKSSPPNCATATDTVTVSASIVPATATGSAVAGTPSTPIADVAAGGTVNGAAATLGGSGNAVAQSGTWPPGLTLNTTSGAITTTASLPPGSYSVVYQLCDKNSPPNCATATDTVTVSASIVPATATGSAVAGTPSTPIANVAAGGTVNGAAATLGGSGNATVAQSGTWPAGISLNTATGAVTTTAAVPPGVYTIVYRLCDRNSPPNCATATDTVGVSASIIAATASGTAVAGTPSTPIASVAAGGIVNGATATLGASGNATVAPSGSWPVGLTLNTATGAVATTASLPPGSYSIAYQLCDRGSPPNCATATDTVTVSASILPAPATGTAVAGTPSTPIANVAAGGRVNGVGATLGAAGNATVAQSGAWPSGLTLNTTSGAITTSASLPPGSYPVVYQLCDRNSPPNCATATDTVTVSASIIPATATGTAVAGTPSTPIANVASGGRVNGGAAALGAAGNATVAQSGAWPAGLTLNTTSGAITTTASLPPGRYSVVYQLCDRNSPPDCATATDTVTVSASIVPATATGTAVAGTPSTPIATVAAGGTVNGAAATLGGSGNATVAQSGTWPAGISLNTATGAVTTTAAVPPGVYAVIYQLCDRNAPANCATATDTVKVSGSAVAVNVEGAAIAGIPSTPIGNIAIGGTVDGVAAILGPSGNSMVSLMGSWPAGITLNPMTGAVSTSASVPAGSYPMRYQLCNRATPPNCATAIAMVNVTAPSGGALMLDKTASRLQASIGDSVQYRLRVHNTGANTVANVTLQDELPLGFKLIPGTALVGVEPATPQKAADPQGTPGPALTWKLGNIAAGATVDIYYQVRLGLGADRGSGINRAQAQGVGAQSPIATAQVLVTGDAFDTSACVVGKIFVDCNGNRVQDAGEPGIPGVRLYFEDGTNLTSDENGNYSICGQRPITHVLKVDATTLPAGSRLVVLSNRNAGDGNSVFVDLRDGELHRADFAEGSCTSKVLEDVKRRRHQGALLAPLPPSGKEHLGVDFESKDGAPPQPEGRP